MKYGLQLFSVRDSAKENFEETLGKVAEMGYKMVEPAGFFGHSAEEVAAMMKKYGLEVCSTHSSPPDFFGDKLEEMMAFHKAIGCYDIVFPWSTCHAKDELDSYIDNVNRIMPVLKKEGFRLHYHNHSLEFFPNKDGQIPWVEFNNRTELMFQVDTFWVYNAGLDPVKFIEENRDRISIVHLKDGLPVSDRENRDTIHTGAVRRALGEGSAPVAEVRKKAIELGFKMVVESEGLDPCGLDEVKRCIDYLHTLDAKD